MMAWFFVRLANQKLHLMKKAIILFLALGVMSFGYYQSNEKASAQADQREGLYVFMLCKPTKEYNHLGSVKKSMAWSGKPEEMLNSMIKKVKKEYPEADAIVFTDVDMDRADAVKFK